MLNVLRNNLNGMPVKILMLVLAFTFVSWGVNDIYKNSGSNDNNVFTVNDTSVSAHEFARTYKQQSEELRQIYGSQINDDMLKIFKAKVLQDLVNKTALIEEAKKMGIVVSNDMVGYKITSHPAFKGKDGKFDKERFDFVLKNSGKTEESFIKDLKDLEAINALLSPFSRYIIPNDVIIDQVNRIMHLKREITLYSINGSSLKNITAPTDEQLQATLKEHAATFSIPEMRKVSYIKFGVADVDQQVNISEAELKESYQTKIAIFTKPETRKLEQLTYSSQEQAKAAKEMFEKGKSLAEIAKTTEPINKEVAFGDALARDAFEPEMGDKIFALKEKQLSEPIASPIGFHLFAVVEIHPGRVQTLEEVKDQLRKQITDEKLFERVSDLAQRIDNDVANNLSMKEIAESYHLQVKDVELKKANAPIKSIEFTEMDGFRTAAFNTELNQTSMVTPVGEENFVVIKVNAITPQKLKELNEVRKEISDVWYDTQKQQWAEKQAKQLIDTLQAKKEIPSSLKEVVKVSNVTVDESNIADFSPEEGGKLLNLTKGEFTGAIKNDKEDEYHILQLNNLIEADAATLNQGRAMVVEGYSKMQEENLSRDYIEYVRAHNKISYNPKALQ